MGRGGSIRCPHCGSNRTKILRPAWSQRELQTLDDGSYMRGHRCLACNHRFLTVQRVVEDAEVIEPLIGWSK